MFRRAARLLNTRALGMPNQPKVLANFATFTKPVQVDVNEKTGIATVTMQSPPVNSLNLEFMQSLIGTLQELEDNHCRGMILTSGLPRVFCAGLEITEMYEGTKNPERQRTFWTAFQDTWLTLYGLSFPTVAAISGHAPAGGCVLSLSCDYRIMIGTGFNIGLNETQLGIVAPKWVRELMLRTVPLRKGELALIQGQMFTAEEALQIGLVDKLAVDKEDVISQAKIFLSSTAKIPRTARSMTKMLLRNDAMDQLRQNKDEDREVFLGYINQPEQQAIMGQYLKALKNKKKT